MHTKGRFSRSRRLCVSAVRSWKSEPQIRISRKETSAVSCRDFLTGQGVVTAAQSTCPRSSPSMARGVESLVIRRWIPGFRR